MTSVSKKDSDTIQVVEYKSLHESLGDILAPSTRAYRDFSHVLPPVGYAKPTDIREMNFAQKVHHMLSDPDFKHFISWMPHGRAFKVVVPQLFEVHVCPKYFNHRSYARFRRDLNENGFRHIPSGRDQNCYYHELMLRHRFFLCAFVAWEKDAQRLPESTRMPNMIGTPSPSVVTTTRTGNPSALGSTITVSMPFNDPTSHSVPPSTTIGNTAPSSVIGSEDTTELCFSPSLVQQTVTRDAMLAPLYTFVSSPEITEDPTDSPTNDKMTSQHKEPPVALVDLCNQEAS